MTEPLGTAFTALDTLAKQLGWAADAGLQLVDAGRLARRHHPDVDPARPALLRGIANADQAAAVARVLANQYPAEHRLVILPARGWDPSQARATRLGRLGEAWPGLPRVAPEAAPGAGHGSRPEAWLVAVPALPFPGSMLDLAEVIAHLRAPEGCPWDRAQTHDSLRPYLIEEAYEAVEAIDQGDLQILAEELGDVLLQVVLHAQVAVEAGSFALPDVIRAITEKLLRRHPHVFGTAEAETAEAVLANWERLKKAERAEKGASTSPFASIPKALPALARADMVLEKLQRRALPAGAPAPPEPASAAALLETASAAAASGDIPARDAAFGQALLALVARARELDVDAETVLREQLARFVAEAEARTR